MPEPIAAPGDDVLTANRRRVRRLGYRGVPRDLPPPPVAPLRAPAEVVDRALVLHVVVSVANGLDAAVARRWLDGLGLGGALEPGEDDYLADVADGTSAEDGARRTGIEGLAVLLWALDLAPHPGWEALASVETLAVLPAPGAPVAALPAALRPSAELAAERDLVTCMAWALGDDDLAVGFAPGSVEPYVVWERRRAMDWLFSSGW